MLLLAGVSLGIGMGDRVSCGARATAGAASARP